MQIFSRLTKAEQNILIEDIRRENLTYSYIQFGVEGTLEGDSIGLFDYIKSRSGTIYALSGLSSKLFTPRGMPNMQVLANKLMQILKNGIL